MKKSAAFTLVEISIVIVIIALIIGAVMTGTNLLRSASLQSIMTDKNRYQKAIEAFRDRYHALPGDYSGATNLWGAANSNPTPCAQLTTASTTKATCDGNGNDSIYENVAASYYGHERFRMWQHLANAELIEGQYAGVNASSTNNVFSYKAGWNAPTSKIRNATWEVYDTQGGTGSARFSGPDYHHIMLFGGEMNTSYSHVYGKIMTPKEMWSIDSKFDDGLPGQGNIQSLIPIAAGYNKNACATSSTADTATYNFSDTSLQCMMVFLLSF